MTSPRLMQSPTLRQITAAFNVVRFGRKVVADGQMPADKAVEFRNLMNVLSDEFGLEMNGAETNENKDGYERDLDVLREVLKS